MVLENRCRNILSNFASDCGGKDSGLGGSGGNEDDLLGFHDGSDTHGEGVTGHILGFGEEALVLLNGGIGQFDVTGAGVKSCSRLAVKATNWEDFAYSKASCQAIKLKDGDEVLTVVEQNDKKDLFFITEKGITLRAENEVPVQGRVAGGVKGIDLGANDSVVYATLIDDDLDTEALIVTSFGTFKKVLTGTITKTSRARKGVKIADLGDEKLNECVVFANCLKQVDKALLTVVDRIGAIYHISTDDVSQDSRTTKGKYVPKIGACQPHVVYCARR